MPQQKLFDKKTLDALKKYPLYSQDGKGNDAVAVARLFHPQRSGAIYLTEYDGDDTFFGYYKEMEGEPSGDFDQDEYGYFSKSELENTRSSRGLGYERDSSFKGARMGDVKAGRGQTSGLKPRNIQQSGQASTASAKSNVNG